MAADDQHSRRSWHALRAALLLASACVGCAHARAPASGPALDAIDYRFSIDPQLSTIEARVCFRGAPPSELLSGVRGGGDYLRRAWVDGEKGSRALPVVDHRIQLRSVKSGACIGYSIDVRALEHEPLGLAVERRGDALVSNIALWLWRPSHWDHVREMSARFVLPEGMRTSLPWPRRGDHYVLDRSALAFYAFAVIGRFEVEQIAAPGATIEVAVLDGLPAETRAHVVPWLELAARAAALPFGRFPRADAQVVVIPTAASAQPVRFGTMNRGGGASAAMLLPVNAELEPLLHDWVAVHEFSHLLHPFVEHDDAWFSEGMATYYQEVLRVRAGMEAEQDAWRRLYEGSLLGRLAEHSLSEESAGMFVKFSFRMVYWAGASFALMSDVELRRRSHGKQSLDDVMRELAASTAGQARSFSAHEVVERMDQIAGAPIFSELMRRWVEGPKLPDLAELYRRLGLVVASDGVHTAAVAEDGWIRDAIMHRPRPNGLPLASANQKPDASP